MMRYLDKYAIKAAGEFEKELIRVSEYDENAKKLCKGYLIETLKKIKEGEILPPSEALSSYEYEFLPDDKYNAWASEMYWSKNEKKLFESAAKILNLLSDYKNDYEFSEYCKRIGFTFEDGWPNNFVQEKPIKEEHSELRKNIFIKIISSLLKFFKK